MPNAALSIVPCRHLHACRGDYTELMGWKPLKVTAERVAADVARLGVLPETTEAAFIARSADPEAAEHAIDELLSREPTHVLAHLCKGVILAERQEHIRALPYARYVTEETPMIYKAWHVRGLGELLSGEPAQARNSFMHYISFATADPTGYCYVALTYAREENAEVALRFLDQITEIGVVKDLSVLTYTRALIEEQAGDLQSALMHFIELQMTAPDTLGAHASSRAYEIASRPRDDT